MRVILDGWLEDDTPILRCFEQAPDGRPLGNNEWEIPANTVEEWRTRLRAVRQRWMGHEYEGNVIHVPLMLEHGEVMRLEIMFMQRDRNERDRRNRRPADFYQWVIAMPDFARNIRWRVEEAVAQQLIRAVPGDAVAIPQGMDVVPIPAGEVPAKAGSMAGKKPEYVPAGRECLQAMRDWLYKHFKKAVFPNEGNGMASWDYLNRTIARSKRPEHRKHPIYTHSYDRWELGFNVVKDEATKKDRYVMVIHVTTVSQCYLYASEEHDDWGYRKGNRKPITDEVMAKATAMEHLTHMLVYGNTAMDARGKGNKLLHLVLLHKDDGGQLLPSSTKKTDSTISRYLVRQLGVASDDVRLNKLAEAVAEWEARENPGNLDIEILLGDKITDAYEKAKGANSCMVGANAHLTKMYAANPEQVGLALLKSGKTALGRALVWFHTGEPTPGNLMGKERLLYVDRMYPACVKTLNNFKKAFAAFGEKEKWEIRMPRDRDVNELPIKILALTPDKKVPYMDTYRFGTLISIDGTLYAAMGATTEKLQAWVKKYCTRDKAEFLKGGKFWLANQGYQWPAYQNGGVQIPAAIKAVPLEKEPELPKEPKIEAPQPLDPKFKVELAAEKAFVNAVLNDDLPERFDDEDDDE